MTVAVLLPERVDERQRDLAGSLGFEHHEHDLVADVLHELPAVLGDGLERLVLELVEQVPQARRRELLGE